MNGILIVYKEPGFTSFDVVAKLRGICKQKKIGHTGTLDPDASGVLPVCLGNATKLCDMLTDRSKEYRAVMYLGKVTDTQDASGKVLSEGVLEANEEQVKEAILSFVGEYDQIPPMYSALKVNGQKLCDLARAGKEVERKSRRVIIEEIEIEKMELPRVYMRVACSKGTYIRTLCHDIGQKLGCGGIMEKLERTRAGQFVLEEARTLSQIETIVKEGRVDEILISTDRAFDELPAAVVTDAGLLLVKNGNHLNAEHFAGDFSGYRGNVRVYDANGRFYAVYGWQEDKQRFAVEKMFL